MGTPHDMWPGRAILHVDIDAFFAAVEQLDHPEWRGLPVIVGGSPEGRGVVSTASYEARRFGIHSAMSAARAAALAPPEAVWAAPRFERYSELSVAVMAILDDASPYVQQVSIDEAFLDVTSGKHSSRGPVEIARAIRERVALLGITCSVGLATSKTVAKIASDHDKPDGLTIVEPGTEAAFLAPLGIEVMSGIGARTAERLHSFGIHTLGELAGIGEETACQLLGSTAPELLRRAAGIDPRPVHDRDPVKSVSNERTFAEDLRTSEAVFPVIDGLAAKVARRLRKKGLAGRTVTLKVRFADFTTRTARRTIDHATDEESEILSVARKLLRGLWHPGVGVRLLGVGVSGLESPARQLGLFDEELVGGSPGQPAPDAEKNRRLARSVDAVRERFGSDAISRGPAPSPDTGTHSKGPASKE